MDGMLVVDDVVKTFRGKTAVDHASFKVKEGSFTALLGPNGSGKSNLIRSMSFLQDSMRTIMMADAMDAIRATLDREGPRQFPDDPKKQEMENAFYYLTKFDLSVSPKFQTSLTSMSKSCRLMGSHDPMHMRYEFDTDSGRLSYDMVFSEDGMLTREELGLFTVGRRTSRLFLVESIGDALKRNCP